MAQYRLSVQKPISRGKGQSGIAKAAYNAREKITDERTGQVKNYGRLQGDDRNYHAHLLMTLREIGPDGFGKRLPEMTPDQIDRLREKWAERGATELRKAGFDVEADRWAVGHLSLDRQREAAKERGDLAHAETLDKEPTKHRGPGASAMERKGMETDRGNAERQTVNANSETVKLRRELAFIDQQIAAAEREEELIATLATAANDNESQEIMAAYGYNAGDSATRSKWQELQVRLVAEKISQKDGFREMDKHLWDQADKERRSAAKEDRETTRADLDRDR